MERLTDKMAKWQGKRAVVLGLGVSNRPLVRLLLEAGCQVTACDRLPREQLDAEVTELEQLGCQVRAGNNAFEALQADLVFRTPGMHPDTPVLCDLRKQGAEITSEMEVFFECCPCNTIAVTGSDGKTTTSTLIGEMLRAAGKTVWLGGNIGTPLLPHCREMAATDYAVVELSSFQLLDMKRSPQRAVITNLSPNHLDIHRDMDEYIQAKKNIFRFQGKEDLLILNADNPITGALSGNGKTVYFSRQQATNGVWESEGIIWRRGVPLLETKEILLPGGHNVENYMAAILAVDGLVDDETIHHVATTFGGVEHRVELVRTLHGVRYYNDSIASSPTRTMAGLRCFPEKVILIAGGYDKNIPYDALGPAICKHVKRLYLNGATAEKIRMAVEQAPDYRIGHPEIIDCGKFENAVRSAASAAEPGDVVLMSPASAAFDQFKNFMVRGNYFKKLVWELME